MGDHWPWVSKHCKKDHVTKHGSGIKNYEHELNAVYEFICKNPNGGRLNYNGRWFNISCVWRQDGSYEYIISIEGSSSDRTLVLTAGWLVITYCRREKPDQGNTGGAASSNQYQ